MASMLRWSQAQLDEYLARHGGGDACASKRAQPSPFAPDKRTRSSAVNSAKIRIEDVRGLQAEAKSEKQSPRTAPRKRAIESIRAAVITGDHDKGQWLELRLDGVRLLSINRLYGLTHFERVRYRKAWHQRIFDAVQLVIGGPRHLQTFDHFLIRAHRQCSRKADTDAKDGYLKYAIDGLRYAGVIKDDSEDYFRDLLCTQAKGPDALIIRIEQVPKDYVPVAERAAWMQRMASLDSDDQPTS